ncbi:glycosyltransferase [Blastochloris viridis]|uniref:Glycosyltransferase n=1 Tax=Blastochloris viridis TaxID=1079 RepID=A0A182CXQ3_BLAVI|nr:glycosyltransferase [Blastochloris viridis]
MAHDLALFSRHRSTTVVVAELIDDPFDDVAMVPFARWPLEPHAVLGWRLGRRVMVRGLDIVVVHQHLPTAAALAFAVAPVPVVLHTHGWPKPPKNPLDYWHRHRLLGRFASVVLVSEACRKAFVETWGSAIPARAVPNALDLTTWRPAAERQQTIAMAARLAPEKGMLEAAQALARVLPELPGWRAELFGAMGDRHPDYAAAVTAALAPLGERVVMHGDRPHSEVQAAFEKAAIALVPSKVREAFGRTGLEAFAGGAALAASPVGGLAELIEGCALPLPEVSAEAMAEAIRKLASDATLRADLAAKGHARTKGFDIRAAAAAYDDILEAAARR